MARTRSIKPGFFENEDLPECSALARLLFIALWQLADRDGYLPNRPKRIKGYAFRYENVETEPLLAELEKFGFIEYVTRESNGSSWIFIPTFTEHQSPHQNEPSKFLSGSCPRQLPDSNPTPLGTEYKVEGRRKKVEGKQKKEEGPDFSAWFDEQFWPPYPLKSGKKKARELAAGIPPEDRPAVIAAIHKQLRWPAGFTAGLNPKRSKLPSPSTWIGEARWHDEAPPMPADVANGEIERTRQLLKGIRDKKKHLPADGKDPERDPQPRRQSAGLNP